jgi:prepilin-type processing-associated H-X9-DG protein
VDFTYHNYYNWYTASGVASFGFNHRALSCTGSYAGWSCFSADGSITLKVKVDQVKRPSQLIMIVDFAGYLSCGNMWPNGYAGKSDWYREEMFLKKYRHNDGANIAFVDGHYEWATVKSKYFDYYKGTEDTRNPYWFNDRVGYFKAR